MILIIIHTWRESENKLECDLLGSQLGTFQSNDENYFASRLTFYWCQPDTVRPLSRYAKLFIKFAIIVISPIIITKYNIMIKPIGDLTDW